MALTDAEDARIEVIENAINQLITTIQNLSSKQQLRQLLLMKQAEVDALTKRVDLLERQVLTLQGTVG